MTTERYEMDDVATSVSRRGMFGMCSLGLAGAAGLAACGSGSDAGTTSSTAAASPSGSASSTPAGAAGSRTPLVKAADVPVGTAVSVDSGGDPVIVAMPAEGAPVAFKAVCPHKFVTVVVKDDQLLCPAHNSTFDLATGENLTGPAKGKPLPPIAVQVVDGDVVEV